MSERRTNEISNLATNGRRRGCWLRRFVRCLFSAHGLCCGDMDGMGLKALVSDGDAMGAGCNIRDDCGCGCDDMYRATPETRSEPADIPTATHAITRVERNRRSSISNRSFLSCSSNQQRASITFDWWIYGDRCPATQATQRVSFHQIISQPYAKTPNDPKRATAQTLQLPTRTRSGCSLQRMVRLTSNAHNKMIQLGLGHSCQQTNTL